MSPLNSNSELLMNDDGDGDDITKQIMLPSFSSFCSESKMKRKKTRQPWLALSKGAKKKFNISHRSFLQIHKSFVIFKYILGSLGWLLQKVQKRNSTFLSDHFCNFQMRGEGYGILGTNELANTVPCGNRLQASEQSFSDAKVSEVSVLCDFM